MSDRIRSTELLTSIGTCRECHMVITGPGARGSSARHHDATGHTIDVEHHVRITYGDGVNPDQLTLGEVTA